MKIYTCIDSDSAAMELRSLALPKWSAERRVPGLQAEVGWKAARC